MTYPNYPPQQPPPSYPPPQQGYPPPQPPAQQYPPQPGYQPPAQQYPPSQPAYYPPPQHYAPPPPVQQPRGSIDDFYDQPAASGKSIAGWFTTPGQSISGIVARALTNADTRPQTDMQTKQPRYFSDGRPMLTMTVPLLVQPNADFPDGRAAWIISSGDREDLDAAMQAAGCKPRTVPEAGAVITITFIGFKQIPGFGAPKKVKQVTYQRPPGAANGNGNGQAPAQQAPPFETSATAPAPSAAPATWAAPATASSPPPQYAPPQPAFAVDAGYPPAGHDPYQAVPPGANPVYNPQPAQQPQPPAPPQQEFAAPPGLTPEQEARLRAITGGQ